MPVQATSPGQRAAWSKRQMPGVEEVRPGLWVIPVPVPSLPIRYTYCYLILSGDGVIMIDPGATSPEGSRALADGLHAVGITVEDIVGTMVTHFHFDHWEAADEIARRSGCWIGLGEHEASWIRDLQDDDLTENAAISRLRRLGVPDGVAASLAQGEDYRFTRDHVPPSRILHDGETVTIGGERLRILWTPGHSPGHVCIYDEHRNILFSGDHLLPHITPHVALNPFGDDNPLKQYVRSLQDISHAYADAEALPAHEYRFRGLRARVTALQADIGTRADEVRTILARDENASVWDIARELTWSRPWSRFTPNAQRMAVVEAASYLRYVSGR